MNTNIYQVNKLLHMTKQIMVSYHVLQQNLDTKMCICYNKVTIVHTINILVCSFIIKNVPL